jgi:hypothetical protein
VIESTFILKSFQQNECMWLAGESDLEHRSLKSVFPAKEVFIMVLLTCISILALLIFLSVTGPGDPS